MTADGVEHVWAAVDGDGRPHRSSVRMQAPDDVPTCLGDALGHPAHGRFDTVVRAPAAVIEQNDVDSARTRRGDGAAQRFTCQPAGSEVITQPALLRRVRAALFG